MKPQHTAFSKDTKAETKKILTIGIIIIALQLIFHLTVGAKCFLVQANAATPDLMKTAFSNQR